MDRETMFKARDKKNKIMLAAYSLIEIAQDLCSERQWSSQDDIIFLQYTGLKDKNGVEIYEGDIIKCTSGCPHEVIFKLDHGGNVLGGMPTFYLSGMGAGYQRTGDEEFIGNIYQNPELLSEK